MTSRPRSGLLGSADRAIACQATARRKSEEIISPVATSSQVASERTIESTTFSTPIRFAAMNVSPTPIAAAIPIPIRRAVRWGARAGRRRVERRQAAGRARGRAVDRDDPRPAHPALDQAGRRRLLLDALVGRLDALGDPRPREALGRAPGLGAEPREPLGSEAEVAELLGELLRVGGRDEDPVDAVGDDVVVAGDVRRHGRRPGGERLREDHAEALAGERGRAEDVGLVERVPQLLARDPAARVDALARLGIGEVAVEVAGVGADQRQPRRDVLDQRLEGGEQHGKALAFLGPADEHDPELVGAALRPGRRRAQIDAVRNHLVLAAEPAATGPGGGLGDRDPRVQLVERTAGAAGDPDQVRKRPRRVGMERADDGAPRQVMASEEISQPGGSWTWTTSGANARSSRRSFVTPPGNGLRFETEPLAPMPTVRASGTR